MDGITESMDVSLSELQEMVKDREVSGGQRSLCAAVHGVRESNTA